MRDLISRQAAIDAVRATLLAWSYMPEWRDNKIIKAVEQLPPIQPKTGHWIEADVCGDITSWECSCCHNWTGLPTGWNVKAKLWFCPKCTADMREDCEKE